MGFGQITSLLLIILSVLAVAEMCYESFKDTPKPAPTDADTNDIRPSVLGSNGIAPPRGRIRDIGAGINGPYVIGLEVHSQHFERVLHLVTRYFYRESKEVELLSANTTTVDKYTSVLRRKFQLLEVTMRLQEIEKEIDVSIYINGIMVSLTFYAVASATLLKFWSRTRVINSYIVGGNLLQPNHRVVRLHWLDLNSYMRIHGELRGNIDRSRDWD